MILVPLGPVGVKESASEGDKSDRKACESVSYQKKNVFFGAFIIVWREAEKGIEINGISDVQCCSQHSQHAWKTAKPSDVNCFKV